METNEMYRSRAKEDREKSNKKNNMILNIRWIFIVYIVLFFFSTSDKYVSYAVFLETLAAAAVYNLIVHWYILRTREKSRTLLQCSAYADAVVLSVFAYQFGGLSSDIHILFIFLIGYCAFHMNISSPVRFSIFCVALYSTVCIYAAEALPAEMNYWRLLQKDFFIVLAAYCILIVNSEVKKVDELHKREFKLARTDKLTGLANRYYFDQKLRDEVDYADRKGTPLNILIFDLDNFKRFNDTYGHVWGDKLLSLFSDIIKQNIRRTDIPVRYGGEEFLLIIRELDEETAKNVGDRIRRQLEKQKIYVGKEEERKRVTVSCGVAQYPRHSGNIKEVIEMADKALYHAKETGKNTVVTYTELETIF